MICFYRFYSLEKRNLGHDFHEFEDLYKHIIICQPTLINFFLIKYYSCSSNGYHALN